MKRSMTRREENLVAKKIVQCLAAKDAGKEKYAQANAILDELVKKVPLKKAIRLDASGRTAKLIDLFADKSTIFKPCGFRRFDIKIEQGTPRA